MGTPHAKAAEMFVPADDAKQPLRTVMGHYATGVGVLSLRHEERTYAATINSLASLSLEPPLVGVSLRTGGVMADLMTKVDTWAVSILARDHGEGAAALASRQVLRDDTFGGLDWVASDLAQGAPLVRGALAWIEARTAQTHQVGDHVLFVGGPVGLAVHSNDPDPLCFFRGKLGAS